MVEPVNSDKPRTVRLKIEPQLLYEVPPHILQGFRVSHFTSLTILPLKVMRLVIAFHGSSTELHMNYSRSHRYKVPGAGNEPLSPDSFCITLASR